MSDEEAYQEALTLVLVLSNKTRYNLISDLYKKKLFEKRKIMIGKNPDFFIYLERMEQNGIFFE